MLRTTIQTTDEATGKELPIPGNLRAKVQRAADFTETALSRLGKKFDIEARWRFEREAGDDFTVLLSLKSAKGGLLSHPFPKSAWENDDTIRRSLWSPLWHFGDVLSEELDLDFARIRRDLQLLTTEKED